LITAASVAAQSRQSEAAGVEEPELVESDFFTLEDSLDDESLLDESEDGDAAAGVEGVVLEVEPRESFL
jgi:hypothetical protein